MEIGLCRSNQGDTVIKTSGVSLQCNTGYAPNRKCFVIVWDSGNSYDREVIIVYKCVHCIYTATLLNEIKQQNILSLFTGAAHAQIVVTRTPGKRTCMSY